MNIQCMMLAMLRLRRFLSFSLALLSVTLAVRADDHPSFAPQVEAVAPGIWRLRFGNPEPFMPTHFRSAAMDQAGLGKIPAKKRMPLDRAGISFQVSDRGC